MRENVYHVEFLYVSFDVILYQSSRRQSLTSTDTITDTGLVDRVRILHLYYCRPIE